MIHCKKEGEIIIDGNAIDIVQEIAHVVYAVNKSLVGANKTAFKKILRDILREDPKAEEFLEKHVISMEQVVERTDK